MPSSILPKYERQLVTLSTPAWRKSLFRAAYCWESGQPCGHDELCQTREIRASCQPADTRSLLIQEQEAKTRSSGPSRNRNLAIWRSRMRRNCASKSKVGTNLHGPQSRQQSTCLGLTIGACQSHRKALWRLSGLPPRLTSTPTVLIQSQLSRR